MANNSPTLVMASLSDDQLKKSIDSLVTHVDEAMKKMVQSTNNAVGEMEAKLKSLGNLKIDSGGSADGGSSRRTSAVEKETKARKELNMTLDQQAAALEKASGKKKGIEYTAIPSDIDKSLTYLVNTNKDVEAQMSAIIQKEQALIDAKQREAQITEQIASAQRAANSVRGVSAYDLGINPNVSAGRQRQIESTRKASKETEYLKQQVASLLEVEEREIKTVNATTSSYAELSQYLKQLQSAYNKLGADRIKKGEGIDIANEIQRTQRAMQKLQQTMSRPVSLKDALGGSEKTLDDIAYKMQRLRAYKQGIDLTKPNATNEIKQVDEALAKLQKDADKWMGKSNDMIKSNTALGRSWNYMKNRLAFYFTVGAGTQFVKNLIEVRSQYEMNERALGILIDSAERGTRIFNELSQMALVSPYTLIELSAAAKQLTAYDVAAKDVVDTTRRLADMAAAVGIPIERLTYALGQIKAYGYLNSRDARMFANAGIPLVKQLADYYTELEGKLVSTADIYDRIKKKAIGYNDVMSVMYKMTDEGGKFFDFQAKMAGTLKVQLANLTLAWNNMLNDIGASEQGTISTGIGLLKELFLEWKNISKMITNLAIGFGIVKVAQLAYYGVVMGTNKAIALEAVLGNRLSKNLRSLASSMNAASMSSTALWVGIATFAAAAVVDVLRGNEAMKEFNKTLRENAENTYNDLKKFSENYSGLRESLYKTENGKQTPVDINSEEAKKAWEVLREQIELSSHASDEYIGKLLSIENVSERLRQGFAMIESIQSVSAAIKELGDSSIKLERDWSEWWNLGLLPDGTIGNLQDAYMWLSKIEEKYGSVVNARKVASTSRTAEGFDNVFQEEAKEFVENYETELEKFREDLQVTKQSIIDFIELKGWSGDTSKINEAFKTFTDNLILKNQLNPQQAYTLQLEMEEARSRAAKQALLQRINDEKEAYKISHDEQLRQSINADVARYNSWNETNGRSKVEWERFTKWLKEQHISETTAMFRNMDAEDIKSLNFQEGKHAEWVKRMVTQYAKEHKMSYDEAFKYLKSWVRNANQWSVFIPLVISTEDKKSVYDQLGEYDKAVDEADAQIERLTKRINELNAKKEKSKEETKELADAEKELTQAQKDKADAEAKGGHGKKEKKDERAANKAAKQAESELAKALKDELSTIDKVRSIYKDLTKEGMSHANAVERATKGWDETVNAINRVLQKNGLQKLNLSKFAGIENPRELVNMLQSQLNTLLKRGAKPAEIKELQTKVNTLEVDADKYDLTKITKGLNNELGKLKEEYELAVELDANPELGGMFADYFGINLKELPKDYEQALKLAQKRINTMLKNSPDVGIASIDIEKLMSRSKFDAWVSSLGKDASSELIKGISDVRSFLHKVRSDETKKQIQEWDKMLEKYAEYEFKRKQITEEYEKDMEIARKRGASQSVMDAITNRRDRRYAELDFNEFMRTPDWIVATGDLAGLTDNALGMLIERIEEYKRTASNLEPKQIKQINKALMALYKEQRKGNPFKLISTAMKEAKNRTVEYDEAINDTEKEIQGLGKQIKSAIEKGESTSELFSKLDSAKKRLEDLKKKQKEVDKLDFKDVVSGLQAIGAMAKTVGDEFASIFESLGDKGTAEVIKGITGTLDKTLSLAAAGSVFGPWGAAIGGALGLASSLFSIFAGKDSIQSAIEDSERAVKRLENAYKELEYAAENAFGAATSGAQQAIKANKELQLVELRRQLMLEQSRDGKHRDEDRIIEIKGQIIDLEHEINDFTKNAVNELLGISSHGDFFESMISEMIEAFKNGEDAMEVFEEKWSDMIDNMIMKTIVSQVLSQWVKTLEHGADEILEKYTEESSKKMADIANEMTNLRTMDAGDASEWIYDNDRETFNKILESLGVENVGDMIGVERWAWFNNAWGSGLAKKIMDAYLAMLDNNMAGLQDKLDKESLDATGELIDYYGEAGKEFKENYLGQILDKIQENWNFGQDSEKQLSNLQQGIQGITEDTAGALEAITNGISQQCYLQSDLLTQIRDAVVGMDMDVQVATQAQMLLQLQQSYAVQMAIQGILEGVLVPSGRAFSVELVS